jgi:hypothetical protein
MRSVASSCAVFRVDAAPETEVSHGETQRKLRTKAQGAGKVLVSTAFSNALSMQQFMQSFAWH